MGQSNSISKPGLTLDVLSGYAENEKTYKQYNKLKEIEGINIIKIPGHESSPFDQSKKSFESKDQIYCDTKVIVEHYRYKPTKTEMAVKFVRIPFSNDESNFESFFKKIQREMNTCKEFPSSSNLVELYGFCIYGGYILICMEYMDMSLYDLYKQIHKKYGYFPHELLGIIAVSIVDALKDLKSKNIMHRDIKPQNILINRQGQIKLCDFGVSRILVDSHATTVTIGTALYWPPERFEMSEEDAKYDIRADVWSLGITLIELLKGKHPYEIDEENKNFPYALIHKAINNLAIEDTIPQDLPNNLKEFIQNCLSPFDARPSYTDLISSSLYTDYKKITHTVIVELILYLNKIDDVQQEQLIAHIKRASQEYEGNLIICCKSIQNVYKLKNCPKFDDGISILLNQIIQEHHVEIEANATDTLKHTIEALIAICEKSTDSDKVKLSKIGIYDNLLLIIEKFVHIQETLNNDMSKLVERVLYLLKLIGITDEENMKILLKNQKWNDILISCLDWKFTTSKTIKDVLLIYYNLSCDEKRFDNIVLLCSNAIECILKISLKFLNSDAIQFSIRAGFMLINLITNYDRHINLFSKIKEFDVEQTSSLITKYICRWELKMETDLSFAYPAYVLILIQKTVPIPIKLYYLWRLANETLRINRRETFYRQLYENDSIELVKQIIEDRQITKLGKSLAELILLNIQTWNEGGSFEENKKVADKIIPCETSEAYELAYPE